MKKASFLYNSTDKKIDHGLAWERLAGTPYNNKEMTLDPDEGLVLFRLAFDRASDAVCVKIRATALGIFELFVNGERVGERVGDSIVYDELKPTWTDYRCRVFEYEYDITHMCGEKNAVVAEVSDGWWSGRMSVGFYGFKPSAFCGEIEIVYADGRSKIISDGWLTSVGGKVRTADIWDGEYYDARVADPCTEPEKYEWIRAEKFTDTDCEIVPCVCENIRVQKPLERRPFSAVVHTGAKDNGTDYGEICVKSKKIGNGCEIGVLHYDESIILDFGQNIVGRPRLKIKASPGTKITGYFAEFLNDSGLESRGNDGPKGSVYIKNYRHAKSRLVYVASGDGEEVYFPLHTFYGFRYLEICADGDIEIVEVAGEVITSDIAETCFVETDNEEVNKLISNIIWGRRGNYLSVPTDCPQRDERYGWTGDTHMFCGAAAYLCDIRRFMKKWLGDARDSQKGYNGAYSDVIPRLSFNPKSTNDGNAAWGDAGIIVPYYLWLMYNDVDTVAEHYDSMEDYMRYLERYELDGAQLAYGDWLAYEPTDKRYVAICYYAYDAQFMAHFSSVLGKNEREEYYLDLFDRIRGHFAEKYIKNGELTEKTQTAYLLALRYNLIDGDVYKKTVGELEKKIVDNGYKLSTGFVGTGILAPTLSEIGLSGLCYSLLLQTEDPSWLYSVRQGATTVWERWNSYTIANGFGPVGMNSFNHYAYGAVLQWIMSGAAGIKPDPDAPGFKHFILAPEPDLRRDDEIPEGQRRIERMCAYYDSVYGRIESEWGYENRAFVYKVTIPDGTGARVEFPMLFEREMLIVNDVEFNVKELGGEIREGKIVFELVSGRYIIK